MAYRWQVGLVRGGVLDTTKMQCLQVNVSDRHIYATHGFYSVSFSSGYVGNRGAELFTHSPQCRTGAQAPVSNRCRGIHEGLVEPASASIAGPRSTQGVRWFPFPLIEALAPNMGSTGEQSDGAGAQGCPKVWGKG